MDTDSLIQLYEILRPLAKELHMQLNMIDVKLEEIERLLPDSYRYPGDPPLASA